MANFPTLSDVYVRGKTVLLRADLNVPMKHGAVTDTTRLVRLLPTLKFLAENGAKIVVLSHFGRPDGKPDPAYSLAPVAAELSAIWGKPVSFASDCIGAAAKDELAVLQPGDILVLENTRFHAGEEANDPEFTRQLASLGDLFVNDAFSAAHRAHASTTGLAELLPSAAGKLMEEELEALAKALERPERPLAAIVGGSKISTKLDLLRNLIAKVDLLILGGGMANTFLAAKGVKIGKSLFEPDMLLTAQDIMAKAEQRGCHIMLPKDVVVAPALQAGVATQTVAANAVPDEQMILDLGPKAIAEIRDNLAMCKTVVWNGPLGAFETEPFDKATAELAIAVADLTKRGKIMSVAGGGDTVAALAQAGMSQSVTYLSTAGGAFLEWLEGKELPGVAALLKASANGKKGKAIL
jgi:phosphoglycerate kinase